MRVSDFTSPLSSKGMWAKVVVLVSEESIEGILVNVDEYHFCFATNSRIFNGSNVIAGVPRFDWITQQYRYGWVIDSCNCGNKTITDIMTKHGLDYSKDIQLQGVINEDNNLIQVSGKVSKLPVDSFEFFNNKYQKNMVYREIHSYHYHHGVEQNAPIASCRGHKIGVELEVEFKSSTLKSQWSNKVQSNWFYCERDGSLNDSIGCEIITVPMCPKDIKDRKTWETLITCLSTRAKSWDSPRCGLHVHIGREILGSNPEQQSETIGKLLYLYHHFLNGTRLNTSIFGRERAYNEKDGKTKEGEAVATLGSEVLKLKNVKNALKSGMIDKSSSDRYFDINLKNPNTIEFRKGRGSIKVSRIIMVIEYCELMCKYAKRSKWEDIKMDNFIAYAAKNISKDSPLFNYFEPGESCSF